MFKLFQRKEEQPSEEEKMIEKLDDELKKLKAEKDPIEKHIRALHSKIFHTSFPPDKRALQEERQPLARRNNQLQTKIDELREAQSLPKTALLWKNNRHRATLVINGNKIEISEDLKIAVLFTCGHSMKMAIYELLRHQSTLTTNLQMYSYWETTFANGASISGTFLCERCLKKRREELETRHIYTPTVRTGRANWAITIR